MRFLPTTEPVWMALPLHRRQGPSHFRREIQGRSGQSSLQSRMAPADRTNRFILMDSGATLPTP